MRISPKPSGYEPKMYTSNLDLAVREFVASRRSWGDSPDQIVARLVALVRGYAQDELDRGDRRVEDGSVYELMHD